MAIFVYGSSCNDLFFGLIVAPLLSRSMYWLPQGRTGCQEIYKERKEERTRPKSMNLHELPHTNIVKYGTFRLASDPGRSLNFGILDCGWVGQALDRGAIQV